MKAVILGGVPLGSLLISFFYSLLQHMLVLEAVFFHSQPVLVEKFSEKGVFFQVRPMVEIMLLGIKDLLCDEGADF